MPDTYKTIHVVEILYTKWQGNQQKKIFAKCLLWDEEIAWTHYEVYCYGTQRDLLPTMTLVDKHYARDNPTCVPDELQETVLNRISSQYSDQRKERKRKGEDSVAALPSVLKLAT